MASKYSISSKEFGRGPATVRRFGTLEAATEYIKGQWQGRDYVDSADSFHSDYCTFTLSGFNLKDVGTFYVDRYDPEFPVNEYRFFVDSPVNGPMTADDHYEAEYRRAEWKAEHDAENAWLRHAESYGWQENEMEERRRYGL